jgi:hypothetical protein
MKTYLYLLFIVQFLLSSATVFPQIKSIQLTGNKELSLVNVNVKEELYLNKESIKVTAKSPEEASFVKISNLNFSDGFIEVELAGKRAEGSHPMTRGFVGIAFRISDDDSKFECFYLRAANGRAEDQVQRNHTTQYMSYPNHNVEVLRKEFPEKYESYVDMVPGEWTKVKIEINGEQAKLYVHGNSQPALIVNDLKLGASAQGSIGLWVGGGTDAHFTNLNVRSLP